MLLLSGYLVAVVDLDSQKVSIRDPEVPVIN